MIGVAGDHGAAPVAVRTVVLTGRPIGIRPSGERQRELLDIRLCVGGHEGPGGRRQYRRAIRIQHVGADGKQLHEFARIVFVGVRTRSGLDVVGHVQIVAHGRIKGDVFHELAIVIEGVAGEHVQVRHIKIRLPDFIAGNHPNLVQGKHHALPQLVRAGLRVQGVLEKYREQHMNVVHSQRGNRVINIRRRRLKLRHQKILHAARFHGDKLRIVGTKRALFEEAHSRSLVHDGDGHGCGRGWGAIGHGIDDRQINNDRCWRVSRCRQVRGIDKRGRKPRCGQENLRATNEFAANHADAKGCVGNQRGRKDKTDQRDRIRERHFGGLIRTGVSGACCGNEDLVLRRNLSWRSI